MELEIEQKLDYFLNEGISSPFSYASIKTLYVFVNIDRIKVRLSGKAENSRGRFFRATHKRQFNQLKQLSLGRQKN